MYSNTVLKASGQSGKFVAATVVIWVGLVVSVFGFFKDVYFIVYGLLIGLVGFVYCCLGIRCPECGQRWYWQVLKENRLGWVKRLLQQSECQSCGYDGKDRC